MPQIVLLILMMRRGIFIPPSAFAYAALFAFVPLLVIGAIAYSHDAYVDYQAESLKQERAAQFTQWMAGPDSRQLARSMGPYPIYR